MGVKMFTKDDIAKNPILKTYPKNEYWITAGSGLVMHGVKTHTRDIDLGCSAMLADLLIKQGAKWKLLEDGTRRLIDVAGDIEIFENWHVDSIVEIDGLSVASLESIRKQKVELNRAKDWDDIALIDEAIQKRGKS